MNRHKQTVVFSLGLLLILSGVFIAACSMFDHDASSPTTPGTDAGLANYWGNHSANSNLAVYVGKDGQDIFSVNLPLPGGYRVAYDVVKAGAATASCFAVDAEVVRATSLYLGLEPGDVLAAAMRYDADFSGKGPLLPQGNLSLYGFPYDWVGWDGPAPPENVSPTSVSATGVPLYANGAAQVAEMENPCIVSSEPESWPICYSDATVMVPDQYTEGVKFGTTFAGQAINKVCRIHWGLQREAPVLR